MSLLIDVFLQQDTNPSHKHRRLVMSENYSRMSWQDDWLTDWVNNRLRSSMELSENKVDWQAEWKWMGHVIVFLFLCFVLFWDALASVLIQHTHSTSQKQVCSTPPCITLFDFSIRIQLLDKQTDTKARTAKTENHLNTHVKIMHLSSLIYPKANHLSTAALNAKSNKFMAWCPTFLLHQVLSADLM